MKVIDKEYLETQFKNYHTTIDGTFLKKNQGATNKGKVLQVGNDGNITVSSLINDTTASSTSVYSSSKVNELLQTVPSINDSDISSASVFSSSKVNELLYAKPNIDDNKPDTGSVLSGKKVMDLFNNIKLPTSQPETTSYGSIWIV